MEKKSLLFFMKLLETHSPSGYEVEYQKVWLDYVKQYASVDTDEAGNVIACLNPDADFKVLLSGHGDEIGMTVTKIDEKGFIRFTRSGGINPFILAGLKVEILGFGGRVKGVVGYSMNEDRELPPKPKCDDFYIDCGARSADQLRKLVRTGDYIVYESQPQILMNDRIVCKGLDDKAGSFIVAEVIRKLSKKKLKVAVYGVSSTGEETNMRGAYFAGARVKPDMAIACDVTFNTDSPGEENKNRPEICLEKGPALSMGSPVNIKVNELIEKAAKRLKMNIQYELTPEKTSTDADKIHFSGCGVPVSLVSVPIRYMHSPIEMASLKDIDEIIDLFVEMISKLTGKEDLRPVKP
ncbi:MAG: M42 family metallopeptidase [Candidatus Rifleibacteriota bacterium]